MSTLLQLNSSLFSDAGQSSQLADRFVAAWRESHPGSTVIRHDLSGAPIPHLDGARFQSFLTPAEARSAEQQAVVEFSDALIGELKSADTVVIGLPLYNLGVPSTLKSWLDHVARAGATFRYTEKGPQGLLDPQTRVIVFATRGGRYAGTAFDTQSDYLRHILGLMGLTQVEFVYAEGLNMGDESKQAALAEAGRQLERLAA